MSAVYLRWGIRIIAGRDRKDAVPANKRLLIVLAGVISLPVHAACPEWSVAGDRVLQQANGSVVLVLTQVGSLVTGDAAWNDVRRDDNETWATGHSGRVHGSVTGYQLEFEIAWDNGALGAYTGTITEDGGMSGSTFDRHAPQNQTPWRAVAPARCAAQPGYTRVARRLGKGSREPLVNEDIAAATVTNPITIAEPACPVGTVWREARRTDYVCVSPESRAIVAQENNQASKRIDPAGAYGPQSCITGYVWRQAFEGDLVCVSPERRDAVRAENARIAQP